jgi:hypothetical protein
MTVLDVVAVAFWPVVLGLLLLAWANRSDMSLVAVVSAALIVLAGIIYISFAGIASLSVLFAQHVGLILGGAFFVWATYVARHKLSLTARAGIGLFGLALIGIAGAQLVGDYLLPRQVVQGAIDRLHAFGHSKGPDSYEVSIDGKLYPATTRLYDTLRPGERVRVEIGRGSGYIYRLERLAP